jgi:hypothetical protein
MTCDKEKVKERFHHVMDQFIPAFIAAEKWEDGFYILRTCFLPVCRQDPELYRMWYEGVFMEWMKERYHLNDFIRIKDFYLKQAERDEMYKQCLMENRPEFYKDEDLFEMIVKNNLSNIGGLYLIWMRRLCGRKMKLDRGNQYGAMFLKELFTGSWIDIEKDPQENLPMCFQLAMDNIACISGEYSACTHGEELPKEESAVLDLGDVGVLVSCMKNGMLRKRNAEEYLEYAVLKGKQNMIPYLVRFQYSDETTGESMDAHLSRKEKYVYSK